MVLVKKKVMIICFHNESTSVHRNAMLDHPTTFQNLLPTLPTMPLKCITCHAASSGTTKGFALLFSYMQ